MTVKRCMASICNYMQALELDVVPVYEKHKSLQVTRVPRQWKRKVELHSL